MALASWRPLRLTCRAALRRSAARHEAAAAAAAPPGAQAGRHPEAGAHGRPLAPGDASISSACQTGIRSLQHSTLGHASRLHSPIPKHIEIKSADANKMSILQQPLSRLTQDGRICRPGVTPLLPYKSRYIHAESTWYHAYHSPNPVTAQVYKGIVELCMIKYRDSEGLYVGLPEAAFCTARSQLLMNLHDAGIAEISSQVLDACTLNLPHRQVAVISELCYVPLLMVWHHSKATDVAVRSPCGSGGGHPSHGVSEAVARRRKPTSHPCHNPMPVLMSMIPCRAGPGAQAGVDAGRVHQRPVAGRAAAAGAPELLRAA